MATGIAVSNDLPFVALPSAAALRQWVLVTNPATGRSVKALVLDVGPHHTDDHRYVFGGQRPRAESDPGSNRAGIDLGEWVWVALGMTDNSQVQWSFV